MLLAVFAQQTDADSAFLPPACRLNRLGDICGFSGFWNADRVCNCKRLCRFFLTCAKKDNMTEEVLDWKEAIARVLNKRDMYVKLLAKFIETERDTPSKVAQALKSGNMEEARNLVHSTKGAAANLGAKALAAAALELEMAVKAGADTDRAMSHFSAAHMDTLVTMHAFMTQ